MYHDGDKSPPTVHNRKNAREGWIIPARDADLVSATPSGRAHPADLEKKIALLAMRTLARLSCRHTPSQLSNDPIRHLSVLAKLGS